MSNASRWASAILAPLIALFASSAWYLSRSVLAIHMADGGATVEEVGSLYATQGYLVMIALVFAGAIAIATGPWVPLILGALALSGGLFALAALPVEATPFAFGLAAIGHAMIMPAIYGALARALDGELEGLRNAAFLVVYAALNAGAFVSPLFGSEMRGAGSFTPVFLTAGMVAACALVLAVILGALVLMTRKKEQPKGPAASGGWARAGVGAAVVLVCAVPWLLNAGGGMWQLLRGPLESGLRRAEESTLDVLNPIVVIGVALLGAVVFVVLHALKLKLPALLVAGIGLAVQGIATALGLVLFTPGASFGTLGAVIALGAIGETLFMPILLSRATADLPLRLETAVAAAWTLAVRVLMTLLAFMFEEPIAIRAELWVGALAAFLVGVTLAAAAPRLRRVFAPATPASGSLPSAASTG